MALLGALWSSGAAAAPRRDRRPTVAVLYFDHGGGDAALAVLRKGLAQMLISELSTLSSVRIVERERLEQLLAELKLNRTRKIDRRTANRMGKLLGARYLVLGSYFQLLSKLRIDAKVVRVETGRIVKSCGAAGKADDFLGVEQQLSSCLREVLAARLAPFRRERRRGTTKRGATKRPARRRARLARSSAGKGPPPRLNTRTALRYARALDARDRGDIRTARAELKKVLAEQPNFRLAARAMAALNRRSSSKTGRSR